MATVVLPISSIPSLTVNSPFATFVIILIFSIPAQTIIAIVLALVPFLGYGIFSVSTATVNAPLAAAFTPASIPVFNAFSTSSSPSICSPFNVLAANSTPAQTNSALPPAFAAFPPNSLARYLLFKLS